MKASLQIDDSYMMLSDGHAAGLSCEGRTVFIADSGFRRVLVGSTAVVLREVGSHEKVFMFPVLFGDGVQGARLRADDTNVLVGGPHTIRATMSPVRNPVPQAAQSCCEAREGACLQAAQRCCCQAREGPGEQ